MPCKPVQTSKPVMQTSVIIDKSQKTVENRGSLKFSVAISEKVLKQRNLASKYTSNSSPEVTLKS
jgi:hypothetical protein